MKKSGNGLNVTYVLMLIRSDKGVKCLWLKSPVCSSVELKILFCYLAWSNGLVNDRFSHRGSE